MNISVLLFYHKNFFEKEYNAKKKTNNNIKNHITNLQVFAKTINKNIL